MAARSDGVMHGRIQMSYDVRNFEDAWGPMPSELAAMETLGLIVAEFKSDPQSVACFDVRIVQKAIKQVDAFEARYKRFFARVGRDPSKW